MSNEMVLNILNEILMIKHYRVTLLTLSAQDIFSDHTSGGGGHSAPFCMYPNGKMLLT